MQPLQIDLKVFDAVLLALVDSRLQDYAQVGPDVDLQDPLVGLLNDNFGVELVVGGAARTAEVAVAGILAQSRNEVSQLVGRKTWAKGKIIGLQDFYALGPFRRVLACGDFVVAHHLQNRVGQVSGEVLTLAQVVEGQVHTDVVEGKSLSDVQNLQFCLASGVDAVFDRLGVCVHQTF